MQREVEEERLLGIELEGWAVTRNRGKTLPVDVTPFLPRLSQANGVPITGKIFRESGLGSIEFAGHPASSAQSAVDNVLQLHRRTTEEGLDIHFGCQSPYDASTRSETLETQKSRFQAIMAASKIETVRCGGGPDDWRVLLRQNGFAATHVHHSFGGMQINKIGVDPGLLFVTNILNCIGPRVARILCDKYDLDNRGHLQIFSKWAAPQRFPRYGLWFPRFEDLCRQFSAIPRFIRCVDGDKENGRWAPDLETPLKWEEHDVAELGIWHLCRLRTSYGTMETRILPALPLELLAPVVRDLDTFIVFLVSVARTYPCAFTNFQECMDSPVWRVITESLIGGHDTLPIEYTKEMWRRDFNH